MLEVGPSAFAVFQGYKFHPALRTIALVVGYEFGMHRAGVLLLCLLLVLALCAGIVRSLVLVLDVLRDHYVNWNERNSAGDYDCNFFSHCCLVVGQAPRLPAGKHGNRRRLPYNQNATAFVYATIGGALARRLRCKINSANENEREGGPVSSNNGVTACIERRKKPPAAIQKLASLNFASSRSHPFDCAKMTPRRILQHCTCEDCSFCFAGLEWNGHAVASASCR